MTNEEKFRAGTVVYKDDDGDYVGSEYTPSRCGLSHECGWKI